MLAATLATLALEFSVIGTIHGGLSPTLRDTAVILDVKSGRTLVLAKGMCLPREIPICIRAINDRTVILEQDGVETEIGRIDGATPQDDGYGDSGAHLANGQMSTMPAFEPPPVYDPPPEPDYIPPGDGDLGYIAPPPPPPDDFNSSWP